MFPLNILLYKAIYYVRLKVWAGSDRWAGVYELRDET